MSQRLLMAQLMFHLTDFCFAWVFDSFTKQVDRVFNKVAFLSRLLLMQSLFPVTQKWEQGE